MCIAAVLSLIAAILLAVGWVRGGGDPDVAVLYGPGGRPLAVAVRRGVVHLAVGNVLLGPRRAGSAQLLRPTDDEFDELCLDQLTAADFHWGRFGFGLGRAVEPSMHGATFWAVTAPAWAVEPLLLVLPVRSTLRATRAARRHRRGQCPACGYDRRGLPADRRCPECGAALEPVNHRGGRSKS